MSLSSISDRPTLGQCLDNLRNASTLVLQDERVSNEAKLFLGELIAVILQRAELSNSPVDDFRAEGEPQGEQHGALHLASDLDSLVGGYQVGIDSASGLILVSNPSTGKTLTCSAEDLIAWAKQHGHADL